jgi:hypothetical protein
VSSALRRAVERGSAPVLLRLRGLPGWVPFVVLLGLVLGGLFAPAAIGVLLLAVLALLVGWLIYLAWPALAPPARVARLVALGLVLAAAVQRAAS